MRRPWPTRACAAGNRLASVPTEHIRRASDMSTYIFDNAAGQADRRFAGLQASYDPVTIRHLEEIGVCTGWSCLEVGGGGGSIARWLADRVTPAGHVVVTDIDPRWLAAGHPTIELRRHDITADELERDAFD